MHDGSMRDLSDLHRRRDAPASTAAAPSALRALPPVHRLIDGDSARALLAAFPRPAVLGAIRAHLAVVRRQLRGGAAAAVPAFDEPAFFAAVRADLDRRRLAGLRRVVNATGIVLHTNLGRAPLAAEAVDAVAEAARGYANLEYDLESGRRGARDGAVEELLRELTGAEAALVVNNNAAAVLLALSGLAAGGEVVVSRGELVEIGGSFRIPDIVRQGGARLVEVGTTNKTRLADYEAAITADTRVLLKVHQSNYRIVGFTGAVPAEALAWLARSHDGALAVVEDLGSGTLIDLRRFGLPYEPTVGDRLAAGIDLVTFSGDKLLGGPQAGVIVGRRDLVDRLRRHPLLRALRVDKMTLAALAATLRLHLDPERLIRAVPVLRMLAQDDAALRARAVRLRDETAAVASGLAAHLRLDEGVSYAGGGSLPGTEIATVLVALSPPDGLSVDEIARRLRTGEPAVVGRIEAGRLLLDMRTVADDEVPEIAAALAAAVVTAP